AMHDADGDILATGGAKAAVLPGLLRFEAHAAVAMSIQVIFAFFGKKLNRAAVAVAGLQRVTDGPVVESAIEPTRLAADLSRRMSVGVRDELEAVELRQTTVHWRVGRQAGLQREDARRQNAVALLDGIEAALRAEHGEPRRPDMRRNEVSAIARFERNFEQITRIEAKDRAAIGVEVSDTGKTRDEALRRGETRNVVKVVDLPRLVAFFVNRGDLDLQ